MTEYFKFMASQLNHMQRSNYCLFFFSLGVQLMIMLLAPITWISVLTFIGTSLGVLCVVAINGAKSVNGWLGILSGICFIIIGFHATNYLTIFEQLAYMLTLDLPVLVNTKWNKNLVDKMRTFTPKLWAEAIAFTIAVAIVSFVIISHTNDARPAYDSIAFAISLTGGLVCFLRYNNQYFWWLASSLAQLILWIVTFKEGGAGIGMLVNCIIYMTNDILAFTVSPWYNKRTRARMSKHETVSDN